MIKLMTKTNEKALVACARQFKGCCHKCSRIGHKMTNPKYLENDSEKKLNTDFSDREKSEKYFGGSYFDYGK